MHRTTLIWFAIAACLGVALFMVKYEVQEREERLADLHREILANQEAVHVLEAEWSYLNRPSRLEALVRRHPNLVPLEPTRLGRLEHLPMRLPALPANTPTAQPVAGPASAIPPLPLARPFALSSGNRQ